MKYEYLIRFPDYTYYAGNYRAPSDKIHAYPYKFARNAWRKVRSMQPQKAWMEAVVETSPRGVVAPESQDELDQEFSRAE